MAAYIQQACKEVSIHAPYIGSDDAPASVCIAHDAVSIHAPYIGSDTDARPAL